MTDPGSQQAGLSDPIVRREGGKTATMGVSRLFAGVAAAEAAT